MRYTGLVQVGLLGLGFAYSSLCMANTSAQEVLDEGPVEVLEISDDLESDAAEPTERLSVEATSTDEPAKSAVEPATDDYGDELLNQLYAE